jgi:hypothetical protein
MCSVRETRQPGSTAQTDLFVATSGRGTRRKSLYFIVHESYHVLTGSSLLKPSFNMSLTLLLVLPILTHHYQLRHHTLSFATSSTQSVL